MEQIYKDANYVLINFNSICRAKLIDRDFYPYVLLENYLMWSPLTFDSPPMLSAYKKTLNDIYTDEFRRKEAILNEEDSNRCQLRAR